MSNDQNAEQSAKAALFKRLNEPAVLKVLADLAPDGLKPEYFVSSLATVFQQSPTLVSLPLAGLIRCAYLAAKLGLPLGEHGVYIVPFKEPKSGVKVATPVVDYRAMVELALQHPKVDAVASGVVFEGDEFDNNIGDLSTPIHHRVGLGSRGNMIGAWAIVVESGQRVACVMNAEEILACRPNWWKSTPWANADHEPEMWRKTVIRRALKTAPKASRLLEALRAEEKVDAGDHTAGVSLAIPADLEKAPGSAPAAAPAPASKPSPAKPATDDDVIPYGAVANRENGCFECEGGGFPEGCPECGVVSSSEAEPKTKAGRLFHEAAASRKEDSRIADEVRGNTAAAPAPAAKPATSRPAPLMGGKPAAAPAPAASSPKPAATPSKPAAPAPAAKTPSISGLVGDLMSELDDAAENDQSVNDRFRTALMRIAGGAISNIKTPEQVADLRREVLGR